MATFPTFFKRSETVRSNAAVAAVQAIQDPFRLPQMPHDDLYLLVKKFDNRVVRQHDKEEKKKVWSAVVSVAVAAVFIGLGVVWPGVAARQTGAEVERAKAEYRTLLDLRRELAVERAALESPARLNALAVAQQFAEPTRDQVVHMEEGVSDSHVARNSVPAQVTRAAR